MVTTLSKSKKRKKKSGELHFFFSNKKKIEIKNKMNQFIQQKQRTYQF